MTAIGKIIGLVGSPNRFGRTNNLVATALEGAAAAGANIELIHLSDYIVKPCKDCLPWICKDNLKCTYDNDAFVSLSQKILNCNGMVLGTPVYWWDTSGMVKYLILKMLRVYGRAVLTHGLPALGIAVAGGKGNGLISGLRPIYHFFHMLEMRALDPLPATRFNFSEALNKANKSGAELASMSSNRHPFLSYEDRLLWYNNLPYLKFGIVEERRFLASLAVLSMPADKQVESQLSLALADILAASGRAEESLAEINQVHEKCLEFLQEDAS